MRSIRTKIMAGAVALAAAPGLAFGACGGHESAEADGGVTVATDQTAKPDGQQAMGETSKPADPKE